ncbi:hypothetical protein LWI29_007137 [Acer saccharum]|uniref:Uncharacterized protein n=1 Tax=Acer saccharum TaxID=4024 RepID=A0AA39RK30_ACESA|nr:hypothetical protein LWI29_007137 [Acer saccharum]KAK1556041.1 hypothetical protein Q3G72_034928 [Acer saccharum]
MKMKMVVDGLVLVFGRGEEELKKKMILLLLLESQFQIVCKSHASELSIKRLKSYELDSTQDLSLQCHIWTLHVGLVGALSFQRFGDCVDVVRLLQWITVCDRLLQKAFNMKFHVLHRLELLQ